MERGGGKGSKFCRRMSRRVKAFEFGVENKEYPCVTQNCVSCDHVLWDSDILK